MKHELRNRLGIKLMYGQAHSLAKSQRSAALTAG